VSTDAASRKGLSAVKGTHDILPGEVELWQRVEADVRRLCELYGFRELRAPVIESTELFVKGTGATSDIVTKEMYTFVDKGGRSITLRPEYTPSVARAIIEHHLHLQGGPMRYYYFGPMFRYDKPQKGRYRQFHQIDVEIFGEKDPAVDAELVEMADALLSGLGVRGTETLVNSVGCRACRPAYSNELRAHAAGVRELLCGDCQRKIETNPLRVFDCKVDSCRDQVARFPKIRDYLCQACKDDFERFVGYLDRYKLSYKVDPDLVRGLDYYTRAIFEVVHTSLGGQQNALLGGGRYDDMMRDFGGPDITGTGFAMGMERLISVVDLPPIPRRFLYIAYRGDAGKGKAVELARFFRQAGVEAIVEFAARGLRNQFARANKLDAAWVLVAGEEEIAKGIYQLKDMTTGAQTPGTPEDLVKLVRQ